MFKKKKKKMICPITFFILGRLIMPPKKTTAKGKGKGKKAADENQGPQPVDQVKKFEQIFE